MKNQNKKYQLGEPLMTRKEAADVLRVSIRTLDYHISSGEMPTVKIGKAVRIRPEKLAEFIAAREVRN